jgi:cysteine-rich secretory family protein
MLMFKDLPIPHPKTINQKVDEWDQSQPLCKTLSDRERLLFYWVNYSRNDPEMFFDSAVMPIVQIYPQLRGQNLASLESDLKNSKPLPLLTLNTALNNMASSHAKDITTHNSSPSHNSTNGETFADRFKKSSLRNCGGENISFGAGDSDPLFALIILYLDINVPELGHRKALLNPNYIYTGISFAKYKNGNTFIVEDFACSQN